MNTDMAMKKKSVLSQKWRAYNRGLSEWRRVIASLMYREAKTSWGEHSLGIVWAFLEPISHILILYFIRVIIRGANTEHGEISTFLFLGSGLFPFFLFRNVFSKTLNCISGNRALLVFPQIKILDFVIARSLLELMTYGWSFFIFILCLAWFEGGIPILNIYHIVLGFLYIWLLGIGLGLTILPIHGKFKIVDEIFGVGLRILYFLSGVMFSFIDAPVALREYLAYIPTFHAIEYVRSGFGHVYGEYVDTNYIGLWAALLIMCGILLVKRYKAFILNVK